MATKKGGNGKVLDLTTRVLIEIRDEARRTNERLDQTNARLDETNARLDETNVRLETGFAQVNSRLEIGFGQVNSRLDNLRDIAGERYRDLDARVRVLEARAT